MKLDRPLQRKILEVLREHYPAAHFTNRMEHLHEDPQHLMANAAYLLADGLIDGEIRMTSTGRGDFLPTRFAITAAGLDFLEDDGGLSAILGTVTVKMHADSIRDLILAQIEVADLESSAKAQLTDTVQSLPAKALEGVVGGLAREGLARMPNAIGWLQTTLSAVSS